MGSSRGKSSGSSASTAAKYRLVRLAPRPNEGLVKLLLACPVKGWFKPVERTETTDDIEALHLG